MSVANPSLPNTIPWTPRVTVAAVIQDAGRFLLVEESVDGVLRFNQPAGHLEDGESLMDAVVRETLEETARHFLPEALVGVYRWRHPASGDTYLRFAFCGAIEGREANRSLDPEIRRVVWMDRAALAGQRAKLRSPLVLRCVDDYLAGRRYPLDLLCDEAGP